MASVVKVDPGGCNYGIRVSSLRSLDDKIFNDGRCEDLDDTLFADVVINGDQPFLHHFARVYPGCFGGGVHGIIPGMGKVRRTGGVVRVLLQSRGW